MYPNGGLVETMRRAVGRARAAAAVAAVVAGLSLAAGCGPDSPPSGGPAPSANGIGPITFATGKDDAQFFTKLIAGWDKLHPRQPVTLLLLPETANGQLAQLTANLQAGSPVYDVIDMDVVWTAEFASAGWVIPLDEGSFPLRDFLRPAVDTAIYHGHLYAVPYYSNADLLYYRKDILAAAGHPAPPRTWDQLRDLAERIAPRYGMAGYAGQFAQYEGLTVNFAEAVQSAGGSILSPDGTRVTVNSPQAAAGLEFLAGGLRDGWIPKSALTYDEESSWADFESGKLLFLNNWPFVYNDASQRVPENKVYGKVGVAPLPGPGGPGSSSLGGANLAVSAYSLHQRTALAFIQYLTSLPEEEQLLTDSGFPPVWARIYSDPSFTRRFPYLSVVRQAIESARPRPAIVNYDQASLVISSAVYQALTSRKTSAQALAEMASQLTSIIRD
jgi:multiple sugar transport system substrate-binding protein